MFTFHYLKTKPLFFGALKVIYIDAEFYSASLKKKFQLNTMSFSGDNQKIMKETFNLGHPIHRALQKFFHRALLETAISGHLLCYKVEIYLRLYAKFQPPTYYPSWHFLIFFHVTVTLFSTLT